AQHLNDRGPEWQAQTRTRLQAVQDNLTRAEAQQDAADRRLSGHRASASPKMKQAEAEHAATEAESRLEDAVAHLARIDERLRINATAAQTRTELDRRVQDQRHSLDEWSELSAVIGSADGKKLRTFAQGLTLESLLEQANLHLEQLRPRYRLERVPKHDMDLMVIDRDLGNESRTLSSLSGGETFLVSLALALSLSTLSARNVRIESLFIDEGFGALDTEALEIALATLDQLQAEGRTVGLISHIPDLAERIGYRVEVRPVGPGTSEVRVHSA
ncbi:MAG: SbcC/MukB-like Walker B domain-containing protein, partial [Myxococcota bacterium]